MADVVNRTTVEYLRSVNTPDYPVIDWIVNPDLSALTGVPQKYWKVVGDTVVEMTQPEKDAVDAAEAAAVLISVAEADQTVEFSTTSDQWSTVLTLDPTNSFIAAKYRLAWSASIRRQSNRGKISLRLLVDGSPAFELSDLDPRGWLSQAGSVFVDWDENTHTVALQIASSQLGRAVSMKSARLSAGMENE